MKSAACACTGTVRGPRKHETGKLESVKGRTDEEFSTAWRTLTPIKPVGQEVSESRHDGKHGEFWGEVAWAKPKSPIPGKEDTPTLVGTARYGGGVGPVAD